MSKYCFINALLIVDRSATRVSRLLGHCLGWNMAFPLFRMRHVGYSCYGPAYLLPDIDYSNSQSVGENKVVRLRIFILWVRGEI